MKKTILCDFDGTITAQDTLVVLLDKFAGPTWRAIEEGIQSEQYGNRVGLRREFGLCEPAPAKEEITSLLAEKIEIDPSFKPFLEFCGRDEYEFVVLSGGFSICIDTVFKKYGLSDITYYANKLLFKNKRFQIEYPYSAEECKECGNCKTMHIKRYRAEGARAIYIGNGTTDNCPAANADVVFAKDALADYCLKKGIPYVPFKNFADIQAYLMQEAAVVG